MTQQGFGGPQLIDAHHHLWDLAQHPQTWMNPATDTAIARNFVLADLMAAVRSVDVIATVVVQSVNDAAETTHLLERAEAADGLIAGVVGWVDLTAPDIEDRIAEWRASRGGRRLVGFRHLVQAEPDADWLVRADVRRGLSLVTRLGLTFDLLVMAAQLPAAIRVAQDFPDARLVVDHLAKPPFRSGDLGDWSRLVRRIGALPNVYAKVSGLVTEAEPGRWSAAELQPAVDVALEAFGPQRLMFGSDWPVCLLAANYPEIVSVAAEVLDRGVSSAERERIFVQNAAEFYGLGVP